MTAQPATPASQPSHPGRPASPAGSRGHSPKIGDLATRTPLAIDPDERLRDAVKSMHDNGVGSVIVLEQGTLVGILTERDLLRAIATDVDPDRATVRDLMTTEVVTIGPDWEVYEAAAEMTDRRIRHLVVTTGDVVHGVVSIRDVLLSGQRIELSDGAWAVLRDPLTFSVRERRRLQRALLKLDAGPTVGLDVDGLIGELVGSWSFDLPLPADANALSALSDEDHELLRAAVLDELPHLQRAVQPAPGWRHWQE